MPASVTCVLKYRHFRVINSEIMFGKAFPTGGFAHSGGLECAVKYKLITNSDALEEFLVCCMENAGSFSVPFVKAAYENCQDGKKLQSIDEMCQACTTNHVANRASLRQGRSLLETCCKTFKNEWMEMLWNTLCVCHQTVALGAICGIMSLGLKPSLNLFMFSNLKTIVASSVRLDIVGPLQAQEIQHRIQLLIPEIITRNLERGIEDASLSFPQVDTVQNCHDSMFSKLFYS